MADENRAIPPQLPSPAELRLLRELWRHGELSVRELQHRVQDRWPAGYTTVLKLLQRMHAKGLVSRRREARAHLYRALPAEESVERRMARDFVASVFEGSVERLLQRALPQGKADASAVAEIQRLLREMEP